MRVPEKSEFPIKANEQRLQISPELISAFHQAFRSNESSIPPTFAARALSGVFEIVDQLQVDWKKLLHATQSFEYLAPLKVNQDLKAQAKLMDCRLRAGMFWLQFQTEICDSKSESLLMTSKSLIMVRASDDPASPPTHTPAAPAQSLKSFTLEPLTREQIYDYCKASGDFNRIHHDDEFARASGLPGIIGHGMLSMGLAARAFSEWNSNFSEVKKFECKFKGITKPGDILRVDLLSPNEARILNQENIEILTATLSR